MTPMLTLSAFWFLHMSAMGIFFPFYALYLRENAALSGTEIGAVWSTIPLVSLLAPAVWGRIADRSRSRSRVLALVAAGTAAGHLVLGLVSGFLPILLCTVFLAVFSTAVIPLGVSVSLATLGTEGHYLFGRARVWGTVGYLLSVASFPPVLHAVQPFLNVAPRGAGPSEPGLELMFFAAAVLTLAAAALTLAIPETRPTGASAGRDDWHVVWRHGPFLRVLAFVFVAYLFLQGPMNFFPTWVRSRGGGLDAVSHMWIVMLLPEIPLVALSGAWLRRIGARGLLMVGVLAGGIRWWICGFTAEPWILYSVQMLHGVVVAGLLLGGPLYIDATVPDRLRSTAQGFLSMAGLGIGGIASSLGTGFLLDGFGVDAPYRIGGAGAVVLGLLTLAVLPVPAHPRER